MHIKNKINKKLNIKLLLPNNINNMKVKKKINKKSKNKIITI